MQLLYHTVQHYNILPITSVCNVRCIFCSHRQNPAGIMAVGVPPLPLELVRDLSQFLDKNKKIVIGESASLIMEGEPFTHPDFIKILEVIRSGYPQTLIQLTTNGSLLSEEMVRKLKAFEPLEINLSINSADIHQRKKLMGDTKGAAIACKAPKLLEKYNFTYHGSIVAMPHLTGFEDIYETIKILSEANSQTIRIFKPGFTRFTPPNLLPGKDVLDKLIAKIEEWREEFCPLTLEPKLLQDLSAEVVGVIKKSPADLAGIIPGDIIMDINGVKPFSRVEAFNSLQGRGEYNLRIKRKGEIKGAKLKVSNSKSGLVFSYDLPFSLLEDIKSVLTKRNSGKAMLLSSYLGYKLLRKSLADVENIHVVPVENHFFGGNIQCAGLLVIDDFARTYFSKLLEVERPDLLILPAVAFDHRGKDITGKGIWELEELTGCPVELV